MFENMYEQIEAYSKTRLELSKLKAVETTAGLASTVISKGGVSIMLALFFIVFNIGIALWLGELFGKNYYGFFTIAAFYLVAGVLLHFFLPNFIRKPVSELIISQTLH